MRNMCHTSSTTDQGRQLGIFYRGCEIDNVCMHNLSAVGRDFNSSVVWNTDNNWPCMEPVSSSPELMAAHECKQNSPNWPHLSQPPSFVLFVDYHRASCLVTETEALRQGNHRKERLGGPSGVTWSIYCPMAGSALPAPLVSVLPNLFSKIISKIPESHTTPLSIK